MKNKLIVGFSALAALGFGMVAVGSETAGDTAEVAVVEDRTAEYAQVLGVSESRIGELETERDGLCEFIRGNTVEGVEIPEQCVVEETEEAPQAEAEQDTEPVL